MKNILITSEIFPPTPGIGGRRWAKFAKYFSKLGIHVHVICAPHHKKNGDISLWSEDVKGNPLIKIYYLPLQYPEIINRTPKSFYEKLSYRTASFFLKFKTKGNIYDRTIFWNDNYFRLAEKIILEQNIDCIIATVAPLHLAFSLIPLKSKYPQIKFVADFRDPWALGTEYGFPLKDRKRQQFEMEKEKDVCQVFDLITVPNQNMLEDSSKAFLLPAEKYYVLEHAIDPDDFISSLQKKSAAEIRIVFIGTLYGGMQKQFDSIFESTRNIENLIFDFYVSNEKPEYFKNITTQKINIFNTLPPSILYKKIASANYIMVVYFDTAPNLMYTKITELLNLKTPILLIAQKGPSGQFIEENHIGINITSDEIESKLPTILKYGTLKYFNSNFDATSFYFQSITERFINRLDNI